MYMTAPPRQPYEKPCECPKCVGLDNEEGVLQKLWRQRDRGFETFALQARSSRGYVARGEARLAA